MTFTFDEVCEIKNIKNKDKYELEKIFDDYIIWKLLPQRFSMTDELQVRTYLSDCITQLLLKT